ncbi:MAG: tRNA adenosine(34) deaminase TadA [Candidatus Omnitrophota bacterium]|jgi:tRNA(adenine34) deaminase
MPKIDEIYMSEALKEAEQAVREDEVPVGCVIVQDRRIIARAHNQVERLNDPTAHAEMIAITQATNYLGSKWLKGVAIYVTIEPCSMCAGAFVLARIERLIYGADDQKAGACGSAVNIVSNPRLNHRIKIRKGILKEECSSLLKKFFKNKRVSKSAQLIKK